MSFLLCKASLASLACVSADFLLLFSFWLLLVLLLFLSSRSCHFVLASDLIFEVFSFPLCLHNHTPPTTTSHPIRLVLSAAKCAWSPLLYLQKTKKLLPTLVLGQGHCFPHMSFFISNIGLLYWRPCGIPFMMKISLSDNQHSHYYQIIYNKENAERHPKKHHQQAASEALYEQSDYDIFVLLSNSFFIPFCLLRPPFFCFTGEQPFEKLDEYLSLPTPPELAFRTGLESGWTICGDFPIDNLLWFGCFQYTTGDKRKHRLKRQNAMQWKYNGRKGIRWCLKIWNSGNFSNTLLYLK